ncbi:hypothetical protein [Bacillus sp. JCM 19034]|nr:hypothetical protein [Bacillus sp. JCM 19034]
MTVSQKRMIEDMQRELERLANELNELKKAKYEGFESVETDDFLTEAYN